MNSSEAPTSARLSWLGSLASLLAGVACYGTLAAAALLSMIGVTVTVNEGLVIQIITGLLVVALLGMAYSFRLHRHLGPPLLTVAAAAVVVWVLYGAYSRTLEIVGYAGLVAASIWDFRVKRRAGATKPSTTPTI